MNYHFCRSCKWGWWIKLCCFPKKNDSTDCKIRASMNELEKFLNSTRQIELLANLQDWFFKLWSNKNNINQYIHIHMQTYIHIHTYTYTPAYTGHIPETMEAKDMIEDGSGRKYASRQFSHQHRQDAISRVSAVQNSARGPKWEHSRSGSWNTQSHQQCRLQRDGTIVTAAHHFTWRHLYNSMYAAQKPKSKLKFVTLDKESNMSTLWRGEEFLRICSKKIWRWRHIILRKK